MDVHCGMLYIWVEVSIWNTVIIDFWWGLLMTTKTASVLVDRRHEDRVSYWLTDATKTASGIGWPTPWRPRQVLVDRRHEDRVRYWLTDATKTASGIGWPTPRRPRQVLVHRRHEDCERYWLIDAYNVGQPIPAAVFMVMRRPKSEIYYCFIKLSGIFHHKDWPIHNYCFFIALAEVSLAAKNRNSEYTATFNAVCGVLTLRYTQ